MILRRISNVLAVLLTLLCICSCTKEPVKKVSTLEELKHCRIGVVMGSIHDIYATENFPEAEIVRASDQSYMTLSIKWGDCDVILTDPPLARKLVDQKVHFRLLDIKLGNEDDPNVVAVTVDPDQEATFWQKIKKSVYGNLVEENRYQLILEGLWVTLELSLISIFLGTLMAFGLCWIRMHAKGRFLRIVKGYIAIIEGMPIIILLLIAIDVIFLHAGMTSTLIAALTFSVYISVYISEIIRNGIESIDKGQMEAGISMGLSSFGAFWYIVVPQVVKKVTPIYKGEIISLVKNTSIVGYVDIMDLTNMAEVISSRTYDAVFILFLTSAIYFLLSSSISRLLNYLEKEIITIIDGKGND